ncbi:MAG: discoidin domain-containing protein [Clostridia bacterium]|nr:discoidin domain-containing protein [Clostridia bacterium]
MKFKKSISFALTLCMVLSLFATFVIPASAEATNVALGKDYTISGCGKAYGQYTASLTDGAAQANLTYDGNWFTFYCNGTDASIINAPDHLGYVIIDLEGLYDITSVKANCYDAKGGSGILGPKAINVYLSEDGENWSEATAAEIPALETASNFIAEVTVSGKAQYVKFEMETQGTFGFVNEVEVYGTAVEEPVTSKVVTDWNPVSYKESVGGATGAFIYDDADVYANCGNYWWIHAAFAPSATVEGGYEVVALRPSSGDTVPFLTIPENGFVWMAWSSAGDTPESSGAYALAFMSELAVGDVVFFKGVDFANKTTAADATAELWVDPNAPVNVALNKDYTLSGEENGTYNAKLTDGNAYGAMTYDNRWFAFTGANTVDKIGTVVVDLGALYDITAIQVNLVNDTGAGVAVPEYANLYVSEDGETWSEAIALTVSNANQVAYWAKAEELAVSAQYVKFEVKLGGTFAFLNEIEVYGALPAEPEVPEELPEGAVEIEYLGYIHAAHSMVAYAEADMTLGALVNKYLGAVKDLNYCKVAICDEDGTVMAVYLTLGREPAEGPNGIKTDLTIAAGQFAVIYNANKAGHEVMDAINVGDIVTLYNVGALKTHTGTAVALENAGFTVEAVEEKPEAGADLSETLSLWGSGDDISVLTNGKTGVGEIVSWESGVGELFGIANSVTAEAEYSFTVVFEETEFNTVTVYALDFVNGFVPLPGSVVIVVDGVEYETVVTPNPNGIATYVADLGEAVTASYVTVKAVMAESTLGGATFNMFSEVAVSTVVEDDESYKDTYTYVDGVNNGTSQSRADGWESIPVLDFWYLVEDGENTVTIKYAVDDKVITVDDTMFRIWVETFGETEKPWTTLYDFKVNADGNAYEIPHATSIADGYVSFEYSVVGNDYFFTVVLDKAVVGIDGEYALNLQLGQTGYNTLHSTNWDPVDTANVPWVTTEFYEVFGKAPEAPVTSQVVTEWNAADWQVTATGANGAYVFTDAEIYATGNQTWWIHASFKPTTLAGVYEIVAIRGASGDAAFLEIPEGGFVWAAHDSAAAGTAGAFAYAFMKAAAAGDRVVITGVDFAAKTTTADATLINVPTAEDMDLLVSHNYNYSWHCFETQIITMAVGEAGLKKAGDAPNMADYVQDDDILYIVELVDGAYKVTGVVGGKDAILATEIPEGGFLYYVTSNCTGYDKICHGELVGKYLVLGEIDLATKFAIDTSKATAYTMKAVSGFKTGDLNLNGEIDATDYAILRKLVLGTLTAEDIGDLAYATADVNGDKVVNARDYYLVKRAFLGTYVIPGWEEDDAE